jgi:peptidoglycan lytic transglycosylase
MLDANMSSILRIWLLVASVSACGQDPRTSNANGDVIGASRGLANDIAQDSALRNAEALVRQGHPWLATQLLAPVLRDPKRRSDAAVLLAARAAAGWEGWDEVERLLARETWIDAKYDGEARELLARSALEKGNDTVAVAHARAAVLQSKDQHARAIRNVFLARALDRLNQGDSSRVSYERAAADLPEAADWLELRAAGVTADASDRQRQYARVRIPVARERVPWTEAQALQRAGNVEEAAQKFAALGATVSALRLRASLPADSVGRARIKSELLAYVRSHGGTADARQAVEVLDAYVATTPVFALTPAEELIVARGLEGTPPARVVGAYARADQASLLTDADRMRYADALGRTGKARDAMAQYDRVKGPLAGQAAYERARVVLNSDGSAARSALSDVIDRYASDSQAAPAALYLLGDLMTDDSRDDEALRLFQRLTSRFPTNSRADDAMFRAGIIQFVAGSPKDAAATFDSLVARFPRSSEVMASRYWSGRSWLAAGNRATADARWRDAMGRDSNSFYASRSAKRLGVEPWTPSTVADRFAADASVDSAMRRIALLDTLGMDVESKFEYDALDAAASQSLERRLVTANALRQHGQTSRAIRLALAAIEAGARDARTYRLAYPLVDRDELVRLAKGRGLDPALVAGLIRQESSFNPRAVSVANARGLMQVLPSVGESVARSLSFPVWDSHLLLDADANLQIGTSHLAAFLKQYDNLPRALAAYNAGGSRVSRWSRKKGTDDPEVFIERIPFVETRDYVRIVQRNAEIYRALYGL